MCIRAKVAAIPSTFAVMTLKIRCRSRTMAANIPTIAAPNTNPPISDETTTVGVPRPLRLTIPVSPPM
ncbi:Uncharacterised protein [Mycobacterium tuberculosis]|uniref:Uncharacterized protein n=1 Tax=Mycobacterium tuberculosis TaxID=1773 RepID=A0A0U0T0T8_MYCTX|nr:hypothetical protein CAB90_02606 [Mycobacterium tuberculosis]CFE41488.1 Uncharacterised protein [Mycobacterium tuberculosis]CFE52015.1 Uncharacterised protein [Mycobacterium tuberculosis]CFR92473.1 Uncharacterised protein [Mycobacterium tuberculosis]CKO95072.1 Uncharacterised protein [Mycobacterium tuberculosis]